MPIGLMMVPWRSSAFVLARKLLVRSDLARLLLRIAARAASMLVAPVRRIRFFITFPFSLCMACGRAVHELQVGSHGVERDRNPGLLVARGLRCGFNVESKFRRTVPAKRQNRLV